VPANSIGIYSNQLEDFLNENRNDAGSQASPDWAGRSPPQPATISSTDELGDLSVVFALVKDDAVMSNPLLTLELHRKSDVLRARHHARQLASLLSLEPLDRLAFSAAVFELAWKAYHGDNRRSIVFSIEENNLVVSGVAGVRLEKALPARGTCLTAEDLPWAVQELAQLDPRDLFEEAHQQNQELLGLVHELMKRRGAETKSTQPADPSTSAA
jgi:hypothetical protein